MQNTLQEFVEEFWKKKAELWYLQQQIVMEDVGGENRINISFSKISTKELRGLDKNRTVEKKNQISGFLLHNIKGKFR